MIKWPKLLFKQMPYSFSQRELSHKRLWATWQMLFWFVCPPICQTYLKMYNSHFEINHYLSAALIPGGTMVKNLPANAGDTRDEGLIPGLGRSPGGGHGNPVQCSCLENLMDRSPWVTKSRTWLSMHKIQVSLSWILGIQQYLSIALINMWWFFSYKLFYFKIKLLNSKISCS